MKRYLLPLLLLCALNTDCQSTTKQNVCDGFGKLTPNLETTVTILKSDRQFGLLHITASGSPKAAGNSIAERAGQETRNGG
ncbi:hypothetical protein V9K92_10605 [Phyllobacterium sp. CCNWLW109]|uniref:hypothetical protein n=1 Tax=Phyllobacterium sp. CCNWLW109 TaxID=3127479 RepID=UPI0030781680